MVSRSTAIGLPTVGRTGKTGAELGAWLGQEMGGNIASLGVTPGYVIAMAKQHNLDQEALSALVATKRDFGASFRMMRRFLDGDMTVEEIQGVFQVRAEIQTVSPDKEKQVSLHLIVRFSQTFAGFDLDDEDLGSKLIDLFNIVRQIDKFGWVKYPDQAIRLLCEVAEGFGLADPGTAVEAMTDGFTE